MNQFYRTDVKTVVQHGNIKIGSTSKSNLDKIDRNIDKLSNPFFQEKVRTSMFIEVKKRNI